eukprot:CAMPEP_0181424420 /NCGR_PEP_ID=MMETSP1110-20121109/14635_1 /TAXON_ID=174948 /ORGANISM="Symbiodinium sp., Strain CCMP421" /LENGTH=360 /DNA_ID=CAMNT_0023547577 /DNA_START=148 /DNA_END=1226 /DNA_ORIENTATION=+
MYFDKEKGRWRERGQEHLEEEEAALPPPPSTRKQAEKKEETAKETSALENMMAPPPNPYGNLFGGAGKQKAPPAVIRTTQVSLEAPPAPADASVLVGGAPAAAAASEGFGAPVAVPTNPFAPISIPGGSKESTKQQRLKEKPPAASFAAPCGQAPPLAPIADPEGGGGERELEDEGQDARNAEPTGAEPEPLSSNPSSNSAFAQQEDAGLPEPYEIEAVRLESVRGADDAQKVEAAPEPRLLASADGMQKAEDVLESKPLASADYAEKADEDVPASRPLASPDDAQKAEDVLESKPLANADYAGKAEDVLESQPLASADDAEKAEDVPESQPLASADDAEKAEDVPESQPLASADDAEKA